MAVVVLGRKIKTQYGAATPTAASIRYVIDPSKTEDGRLVSANYSREQRDWQRLARPMEFDLTHAMQGVRADTVWAYHVKQSFAPDDPVTPEQVHELGERLAEYITGGDCKWVVATHVNRAHVHNHIIICAASDVTGRHMRLGTDCITRWRAYSDRLCREQGLSVIDRPRQDRAPGWGELMAGAHGQGVKDRIRTLIDMAAAGSNGFDEFSRTLAAAGVTVTVRGSHLTFENMKTGFRVRDSKLGRAYDQTGIMARLSRDTVTPISFNERLIDRRDAATVTVWLPGTKRRSKITLPADRCIASGSTWRAFLPEHRDQTILDRNDRVVRTVRSPELYEWFGRPTVRLGETSERRLTIESGVSEAQRRYYRAQGHRLDDLADMTRALDAATRWTREADGDADRGLGLLRTRVRDEQASLQSAVVALADAIDNGDKTRQVEAQQEMKLRERRVERLEGDLRAIERALGRERAERPARAAEAAPSYEAADRRRSETKERNHQWQSRKR